MLEAVLQPHFHSSVNDVSMSLERLVKLGPGTTVAVEATFFVLFNGY